MKIRTIALACIVFAVGAGQAAAQSCASPGNLNVNSSPSGDTCAGANDVGTFCGVAASPQKEQIYSVTLAAGYTATTITLTNTGGASYSPGLVLYQGTCANGDNCQGAPATGAAGAGATLSIAGTAAGSYFLAVTADPAASSTSCGTYGLATNGTLPVKLQAFSVN